MRRFCGFAGFCAVLLSVSPQTWAALKTAPLRTEADIEVDGRLDESVWQTAPEITDFLQFEPKRGSPPSVETVFRVVYDDQYIYFAADCRDPSPGEIVARLTKRDADLETDDAIAIGLDTFDDDHSGYYFFTNLLGTQADGRITDNGRTLDAAWDGRWLSAAQRTEQGWTVEIAIPFSILKFDPGEGRSWGLGLVRFIPRKMEVVTWGDRAVEAPGRVSQFGALEPIELKKSKKSLETVFHVIGRVEQGEDPDVQAGFNLRYAISQSLSANMTVNPDFATIEADQEQVNLSRFELALDEKRHFFLEGAEAYRQRIRLFYSRRIADIFWGAKLYGKAGGTEYSGLSVQSKPGLTAEEPEANFSVVRVKQDIFRSSTVGLLAANRVADGQNRGSVGLDTTLFFSERVNFTGQLAMSYGEHNAENVAFFVRPSYDSPTFHLHLRYTRLGEQFADNANAVGFVKDDNRSELDSALDKSWWIEKYGFDRIAYGSNYNIYWSTAGELRAYQIDQEFAIDFSNKMSLEIDYQYQFIRYEKAFRNDYIGFEIGYNTREWQSVWFDYRVGRSFDADFVLYGTGLNYKLTEDFSLEYLLNRLVLTPDPEGESTWIHVVRASYYFTNDLFLKAFYQTNIAIEKHNVQALFVYRFQPPFGTVQLAYQRGTARFGERGDQGNTLFLKASYVF